MVVKISAETLKAIGAETASDFEAKLSAFITEANQNKLSMAENTTTIAELQASIKALEGKIVGEDRIKTICAESATSAVSTWAGSEAGKKLIGGEASRVAIEALANVGTTPARPAPASAEQPAKKTFAEIVQAGITAGKTKTAAISAAVETNPEEYKAYLQTGGKL
jgi:hypothetical protein